jgi:hypothetical protein
VTEVLPAVDVLPRRLAIQRLLAERLDGRAAVVGSSARPRPPVAGVAMATEAEELAAFLDRRPDHTITA